MTRELKRRVGRLEAHRSRPMVPVVVEIDGVRWHVLGHGLMVPAPMTLNEWARRAAEWYRRDVQHDPRRPGEADRTH